MSIIDFVNKVVHYFNIESELESHHNIHNEILKGVVFKGTNLWILFFAIIVASIGLNMNSTAVIIGAMLISPLMGPINGMGYSIATYNGHLFRISVKNFTFAVLVSLVASTAYFALSPISTAHSEILARTSPTIYDVLIALFGGLAGIVAISSKQKGNVIPGVAIATALMPPLCTAGYGLAKGEYEYFFGAFFLFTINTVFIAIASVAISRVLKFPIYNVVDSTRKKQVTSYVTTVLLLILIPSIYFGYLLVKKEKFEDNAKKYIASVSMVDGNYLLNSKVDAPGKEITLIYGGLDLSTDQEADIKAKAGNFGFKNTKITIERGISFAGLDQKKQEIMVLREELLKNEKTIKNLNYQLDSIAEMPNTGKFLLQELQVLFPQVESCAFSKTLKYISEQENSAEISLLMIGLHPQKKLSETDKRKIKNWLISRLDNKEIEVVFI